MPVIIMSNLGQESDIEAVLANGAFLNQELLDNNLADKYVRY